MPKESSEQKTDTEVSGQMQQGVMVPLRDDESGHCEPGCPFLAIWDHPYFHHTGWCWKQMRDLGWYDYWLADCIDNKPDPLENYKASGRTKAP